MMSRALTGTLRGESIRVDKQGPRLDARLMRDEIEMLATEVADHDIRGRFATVIDESGML